MPKATKSTRTRSVVNTRPSTPGVYVIYELAPLPWYEICYPAVICCVQSNGNVRVRYNDGSFDVVHPSRISVDPVGVVIDTAHCVTVGQAVVVHIIDELHLTIEPFSGKVRSLDENTVNVYFPCDNTVLPVARVNVEQSVQLVDTERLMDREERPGGRGFRCDRTSLSLCIQDLDQLLSVCPSDGPNLSSKVAYDVSGDPAETVYPATSSVDNTALMMFASVCITVPVNNCFD